MDPDEFLKAHGHDAFLKYLQETTPLVKLLWRKNTEGRVFDTPEQKALIEKNVMEEVAKIADEKVRGYYQQEMQNYIYNELGRGFWKNKQRQSAAEIRLIRRREVRSDGMKPRLSRRFRQLSGRRLPWTSWWSSLCWRRWFIIPN